MRNDFYLFWSITGLAILIFISYQMVGLANFPAHPDMGGNATVVIVTFILSVFYLITLSVFWLLVRLINDERTRMTAAIIVSLLMPIVAILVLRLCLSEPPEPPGISPPHAPL